MRRFILLAAIVALCLPLLASDDLAKQQEAIKKIEQAVAKTNIFELPSFQMKASVQIESQGKLVDGSYQLLWNGPEQWKEEIHFPGYKETQVGGKGVVFIQRTTDFYPLRIYDLHSALGFGSSVGGVGGWGSLVQADLAPKDKVEKVHRRKEHGEAQTCVEYENAVKRSLEVCVSESTNTLARDSLSHVDKDIQPVGGGKVYPRVLSFIENGKTLAKANVTELAAPAQFPPDSFIPPAGLLPIAGCMNPVPPRLIKKVTPQYPESARQHWVEGTVVVDAWIGLDGIPRIGEVVGHSSPDLERSSVGVLREWRYEPATCNGKPVEVDTLLQVNYSLHR